MGKLEKGLNKCNVCFTANYETNGIIKRSQTQRLDILKEKKRQNIQYNLCLSDITCLIISLENKITLKGF